ncbi:ATP-binding protein [Bacillus sp. FJAT-27251]|uniref:ATP-binding protein n=1 Tax=Bacillus sp. FJAT-27251 TaxID=1684142 RepID=UPI0006A774A0|nr:ATP-binding protein [Bacillus sp. FJAT-27251]
MNKSSVKKTIRMNIAFILILLIGIMGLRWYQVQLKSTYDRQLDVLTERMDIVQTIESLFDDTFYQGRSYLAFEIQRFLAKIDKNGDLLDSEISRMETRWIGEDVLVREVRSFKNWYYTDYLPLLVRYKQENNQAGIQQAALDQGGVERVDAFLSILTREYGQLSREREELQAEKEDKTENSQLVFFVFIIVIIMIFLVIFRLFVRQLALPLQDLADTASQISKGAYIDSFNYTKRNDEVGILSRSLEKMVQKLQSSETELMNQNEELFVQQEELTSQQRRLEEAFQKSRENEELLSRRNQFINGLINTLDRKELLDSIIDSMVHFTKSTKGLIVLLDEHKSRASHGLNDQEIQQFLDSIDDSAGITKMRRTLEPFVVRRESTPGERGYVTEPYSSYDLTLPIFLKDSELAAVLMVTRLGHEFSDKEVKGFDGFCKQISLSLEKLNLYQESENSRKMVQNILNSIHEGIQLVNEEGELLHVNDKLKEILGLENQTLLRGSSKDWMGQLKEKAEHPDQLAAFLQSSIHGEQQDESFIFQLKTTPARMVQLYAQTLYRDGKKSGTIFEYHDITKQYEVDQMKSEFVSTVSHELRTPLSSVLGFTELMLNKELKPERQRKYLLTISQEAKRLTSLINDFLDVQKMESGKQTYHKDYCDLQSIVEDVVRTQRVNTDKHEFVVNIQAEDLTVLGDQDKLIQVFGNLLSNAVKYSPNGGKIIVNIREEHSRVAVDIIDEGLGIPAEAIPNLFTKFYRIDNSDRRKIGGTGLGLSIVKEIIKAHDGDVQVRSEPGAGSTFTIRLPLVIDQSSDSEGEPEEKGESQAHIILVEDDLSLASLLKEELKDNGFFVTHYTDGEMAIENILDKLPDAVVVDIMLENSIDGWSIIKRLKADPKTENIPIFISTAIDEQEKGHYFGAEGYLTKPFQLSRLSNYILQVLLENEREGQIMLPNSEKDES